MPFGTLITIGLVLLIVSIVLYALGASGTAGMTAGVGKLVLLTGVVLFVIILIVSLLNRA